MNKPKLKKQSRSKLASQEDIEFVCEMICREFGSMRTMSFKVSHKTIGNLLQKKNGRLEPEDYHNFLSEMIVHAYFVTVTEDYFIFVHSSLANSLKEADNELTECFEYCRENLIKGCSPIDLDESNNLDLKSKRYLH